MLGFFNFIPIFSLHTVPSELTWKSPSGFVSSSVLSCPPFEGMGDYHMLSPLFLLIYNFNINDFFLDYQILFGGALTRRLHCLVPTCLTPLHLWPTMEIPELS